VDHRRNTSPKRSPLVLAGAILIPLLVFYVSIEFGYSLSYRYGWIGAPTVVEAYEASYDTVRFDPDIGYRLGPRPARYARFTHGELEFDGVLRGNGSGFADRSDFFPASAHGLRIAVLGDSNSMLHTLEFTWPARVEDLQAETGRPLRLLNFSVYGGGLATWWCIVERELIANEYEIDAIIFPVYDRGNWNDFQRSFFIWDHRTGTSLFGMASSWDPGAWPTSWEAAQALVTPMQYTYVLNSDEFERFLSGKMRPDLPRPWDAYLLRHVVNGGAEKGKWTPRGRPPVAKDDFVPEQTALVEEMAAHCRANGWPVLVIRVPGRRPLLNHWEPSPHLKRFTEIFDAAFIDGADAFAGLTREEVRAHWYPHDGHWNQRGSDRFAEYVHPRIVEWTQTFATERSDVSTK